MMLQVMQGRDEDAKLANTTVQSIISAYNQEPVNRLHTAQAATVEALQPGAAAAQQQTTEHSRLVNALLRGTNPISLQSAQLKLEQERAIGNLPVDLLRAQVTAAQAKNQNVMDIDTGTKDAAGNPVIMKNIPVSTAAEIYTQILSRGQQGQLTQENIIANARNDVLDEQGRQERANKAEQNLLGPVSSDVRDRGNPMLSSTQSQPHIDEFNKYSDKGYAYVWGNEVVNPSWYKSNTPAQGYRVYLPRDSKGQLTAKQAYSDATKLNMTMREYLEALHKKGRIKEKLPWLP